MFFIDLGERRNFDPRINDIDNVYLYNIDDLETVTKENLKERIGEVHKAEEIVDEEVERFLRWLGSLDQVPTIVALRRKVEEIRQREMERSLSTSLKGLLEQDRQALEDMTTAMINKILHAPTTRLKKMPGDPAEEFYVEALKRLFDLEEK
jgi:glutamyl-tRNA reductase